MRLDVLQIDGCPSSAKAADRAREALTLTQATDAEVVVTTLRSRSEAAQVSFAGSPTFLLDGDDLFPSDGETSELACRVYATPGGLAGLPTIEQLVDAIASPGR